MSLSGVLDFDQEIQNLLMLGQSLFRRQLQGLFDKGHIKHVFRRRPPSRPRIGRINVFAINLGQCLFVHHEITQKAQLIAIYLALRL